MTLPKETRHAEGRDRPEGSLGGKAKPRTQGRATLPPNLVRVNESSKRNKSARFTSLLHHVDEEALQRAFRRLRRKAAAGVDGETVATYEQDLSARLRNLHDRVHSGRYRACPARRVYIPKTDGGQRPLGIPTLEDKIVQSAVAETLSAVYETDFLGFSYGFRPGRSPHDALRALHTALMTQYVGWVLDADIRSFFDSVDHEWLLRMLAHRIADKRVVRLIKKWLRAGILEANEWRETTEGTPQGAGISPLLANIFLHYVLDLWVQQWRKRRARGRVVIVRYADDFVMGFQYEADAREMLSDLKERLAKFKLRLHEGKTRLIEFGKLQAERRRRRGERRPRTFAFLGFTHYCAWSRTGAFVVKRRTERKRLTRKLAHVRSELWRRMHAPLATQQQWLSRVLHGHYAYYGLPSNWHPLGGFCHEVKRTWYGVLRRRSQRRLTWAAFHAILDRFPLPSPHLTHSRAALAV
jgi:RNA-directed DNA polymerase